MEMDPERAGLGKEELKGASKWRKTLEAVGLGPRKPRAIQPGKLVGFLAAALGHVGQLAPWPCFLLLPHPGGCLA